MAAGSGWVERRLRELEGRPVSGVNTRRIAHFTGEHIATAPDEPKRKNVASAIRPFPVVSTKFAKHATSRAPAARSPNAILPNE